MSDKEFFERIGAVKQRLYRIARGYLSDEEAAMEAVDEAVFSAFRGKWKLRSPIYLETWITRILINECLHELRRSRRESAGEPALPEQGAEDPSIESMPLREAVRALPEPLRHVIILRYFGELTLAQTAKQLGIPQGTAATRQRRALSLLKISLNDEEVRQ